MLVIKRITQFTLTMLAGLGIQGLLEHGLLHPVSHTASLWAMVPVVAAGTWILITMD